ncbi:hypothetical protein PHISCL_10707 [Aspergillus sclerotialis]|uniref:Uncharacterized protein n=1 Tax=Aspergillus sclerotialis TaxID=2070753 RepID=A0A3A2Z259_9EURO|nr:hypothetical protein PHISCL_10707 [Aspergillus sclerotialis]
MLKFKLTNEVAHPKINQTFFEQQPGQCMDAVDDLWQVFLLIQVNKFEPKELRQFDLVKQPKE